MRSLKNYTVVLHPYYDATFIAYVPAIAFIKWGGNPRIGVVENIMLGRDSSVFSLTYQMVEEYQKS